MKGETCNDSPSTGLPPAPQKKQGQAQAQEQIQAQQANDADGAVTTTAKPKFANGDLVMVKNHAWAGKDVNGGIAHIIKVTVRGDGDAVYDARYVVGGTDRGIDEHYIDKHDFQAWPARRDLSKSKYARVRT
eukprot:CAMPEP_0198120930 /NCGR_PEP_ID=MMETSP1442-20131203/30719_1 /TAXON_ID= /ORGANISM="Craspedostauros australis, Strain CCMP3328" /LENGTH=131 /DNA_ID=CAMNT_0043779665 /DNA_START=80 /DNA_END=475 /DNA_ORIENTATION=+